MIGEEAKKKIQIALALAVVATGEAISRVTGDPGAKIRVGGRTPPHGIPGLAEKR